MSNDANIFLAPIHRSSKLARVALLLAICCSVLLAFGVPAANAANYHYASSTLTPENSGHDSGLRSVITGGAARADGLNAEGAQPTVILKTYHPAPGYNEIARASAGSSTSLTHGRATNVHSSCSWTWSFGGGNIGSLPMTCSARY